MAGRLVIRALGFERNYAALTPRCAARAGKGVKGGQSLLVT